MAHWLVKTEPSEYSWSDLEREGHGVWDGVRNPQALKNLRAMRRGDSVLVYHFGKEKEVVGLAAVASEPYPDPEAGNAKLWVVDLVPTRRLERPVSLAVLKVELAFADSPLVRQGRLSVVSLTEGQFRRVSELSNA